jgi:Zn-dependent protease
VSSSVSQPLFACKRCGHPLAQDALVCSECHALVHAAELDRLAASAKALEAQSQWRPARDEWLKTLALLPKDSTQAEWVGAQARKLEATAAAAEIARDQTKWARRLGPLAPIALALLKGKTLFLAIFKLKFLITLAAFVAFYWHVFGMKFGAGFAILILIHEMGHYIDIKRRGLPAEMPVFLPGLGAFVQWQALGVSAETRAKVSLAGPMAGLLSAFVCALVWWKTGNGLWAALARAGAWLNLLNLIPVWVLDGGQAAGVLSKNARILLLCTCLVAWYTGRELVYLPVACGMVYRLFTKDLPEQPSQAVATRFLFLLVAMGLLLWFMPGEGFGAH